MTTPASSIVTGISTVEPRMSRSFPSHEAGLERPDCIPLGMAAGWRQALLGHSIDSPILKCSGSVQEV
jgi:hypothetical protein